MNSSLLIPEFPEVVDSTMRSDYASCAKKFEYSRIFGLASLGGSVHLIAGGAFAKGVEVARRKYYQEGLSEEDAVLEGVLASFIEYGDFEPEEKYEKKSAVRVAYAIVEYFCEYPMKTDKLQPYFRKDGSPAIEFTFTFPLEVNHPETGNPLLYAGRFDLLGSYMNGHWVVDEKTATMLGASWLDSFTLRGQLIGYCYAARKFEIPVNGFFVRGISFLKDYYGHAEVIEVIPEHRLERWWIQINEDFERAVTDWKRGYFGYDFGDSCNAYGGCPYKKLCDKEHWEEWWQGKFEIARWNPLERVEVKPEQKMNVF